MAQGHTWLVPRRAKLEPGLLDPKAHAGEQNHYLFPPVISQENREKGPFSSCVTPCPCACHLLGLSLLFCVEGTVIPACLDQA